MKNIISFFLLLTINSCYLETIPESKLSTKGPTKILGKVTIVNSDIPVEDIDVYLWTYTSGIALNRQLVDETISDSTGAFELNFDITKPVFLGINYNHTPYLSYRHVQEHTFNLDGKTHQHHIEMVPPSWVNVRIIDKSRYTGYTHVGVKSENFVGGSYDLNGPKDTTILVKVFGNLQDTIHFEYLERNSKSGPQYQLLKSLKFPVFVPPFQVQEMTIEY